jgi:hypothetical protein
MAPLDCLVCVAALSLSLLFRGRSDDHRLASCQSWPGETSAAAANTSTTSDTAGTACANITITPTNNEAPANQFPVSLGRKAANKQLAESTGAATGAEQHHRVEKII